MIRKNCLVCNSENLHKIIDLGSHPFADTFVPESRISEPDLIIPLVCDLCQECGHVQNRYETDPLARYSQIEYSYTSSNSEFAKNHWNEYAKEIAEELQLKPGSLIVEAGSNDGYLIEQFMKNGHKVVGVDPSPYMADLAKKRNIQTVVALFGKESSQKVLNDHGKADLIIANNVYNHADNPIEFTKSVATLLNAGGSFVFEQPYWLIGLKSGKFDQIYHEHVSYYTVKSASRLLSQAGLKIISAKVVDYHGGSLRIIAKKQEDVSEDSEEEKSMISQEESYRTFDIQTYEEFMRKNLQTRHKFLQKIYQIKEQGHPIIAVGAPAKGNTFLNFYRLDSTVLDYVTDASPHKQGKYTPATRIPIVGDEIFSKYGKVYAIVLSWNIVNLLKEKLSPINSNIEFLVPEEIQ